LFGTPWTHFHIPGIGSAHLEGRGRDVLTLLARLVTVPPANRLARAVERIARVNADPPSLHSMPDAEADLLLDASRDVFEAFLVTWTAVERPQYRALFPVDKMGAFFEGADSPEHDTTPSARNAQFELLVGAHFALGGAAIERGEPDYVVHYGDRPLGIAVKRLSSTSPRALESRLREGSNQIARHQAAGLVAVNLDGWVRDLSGDDSDTVGTRFEAQLRDAYRKIGQTAQAKLRLAGVLIFGTWLQWNRVDGRRALTWRSPFQFIGFADTDDDQTRFTAYFADLRRQWEESMRLMARLLQAAA
jgi:hypothetical protein